MKKILKAQQNKRNNLLQNGKDYAGKGSLLRFLQEDIEVTQYEYDTCRLSEIIHNSLLTPRYGWYGYDDDDSFNERYFRKLIRHEFISFVEAIFVRYQLILQHVQGNVRIRKIYVFSKICANKLQVVFVIGCFASTTIFAMSVLEIFGDTLYTRVARYDLPVDQSVYPWMFQAFSISLTILRQLYIVCCCRKCANVELYIVSSKKCANVKSKKRLYSYFMVYSCL